MKQVFHVFKKDVRHYWREGAASIALMAVFAWYDMRSWAVNERAFGYARGLFFLDDTFLSGLASVLLPVSWGFVIVRVIQGESLVGDRQFWVTRPYDWRQLLAAKALFALVFINLPLLIADVVLLTKAGFNPGVYVVGLLYMQTMIALLLSLIGALTTVTKNLAHLGLALLVVALYMVGMVFLSDQIPSSNFSSSLADSVQTGLLVFTAFAVILSQYSRRKTTTSRLLIVGFAVVLFLILVATPYRLVVAHAYPLLQDGQRPPVGFALLPAEKPADGGTRDELKEVQIRIPVSVTGVADDSIVVISGVMIAIQSPNGLRWNSGWKSHGTSLFPEERSTWFDFTLKKGLFERIKAQPVRTNISLALSVYRDQNRRKFIAPQGEFLMTGVGLCNAGAGYSRNISCRAPMRTPSSLLVTSDLSQTTCSTGEEESRAGPGTIARDWHQNSDSDPAEFGVSPIKTVNFYLRTSLPSNKLTAGGICPGTPLILSNPELLQTTRIDLELKEFNVADYRQDSVRGFVRY